MNKFITISGMEKMKAAVRRSYGFPKEINIEEIEKPFANDNEVLINVHSTTVSRTDCANLSAKPFIMRFVLGFFKPKKIVLGTDFAGKVVAIGKNIGYKEAAASLEGAHYAYTHP